MQYASDRTFYVLYPIEKNEPSTKKPPSFYAVRYKYRNIMLKTKQAAPSVPNDKKGTKGTKGLHMLI